MTEPTYQFDPVRWLKVRARVARQARNFEDENSFLKIAREIERLRQEVAHLLDERGA